MLCTVTKRRTVLGVHKERRCRTGEIPWLLPLQQGGLHSFFQWQDGVALWGLFPLHGQHACQHRTLTQRSQVDITDVQQRFSASAVQGVHMYYPCGCYLSDLGCSEEVHVLCHRGLSLPVIATVFLKWYENPLLPCDPNAEPKWNSPDTSRT